MRRERLLFISSFLVMILLPANAQVVSNDLQAGLMPYQSYHGGKIDNISLSSGGLNIQIPLVSYPQRGGRLKMDFELVFNGKPLVYTDVCTVQVPHGPPPTCQWRWIPNSSTIFGPGLPGHAITGWYGADSQGISQANYIEKVPINNGNSYQNYSWVQVQTADGSIHPSGQINGSSGQITLDGSNYASVGWGPTTGCSGTCYIQDPDGIMYNNTSWSSTLREDYDGNEISLASGTYTDTVGRSIPAFPTPTTNFTGQQASVCRGSLPIYELAIWMIPGVNGSTQTYTFCYAQVPWLITNNPNPPSTQSGSVVQLQSVALPNGLSWVFAYDATNGSSVAYGDLTSITFPTGGTISYTYQSTASFTSATSHHVSRWVATRAENANDGQGSHQSQYAYSVSGSGPCTGASSRSTTVTDAYGNQTVHSFSDALCNGYETSTQYYNGASSGGALLKSVAKTYNYLSSQSQAYFYPDQAMNVFPASETTTLDNGLSSVRTWSYCCSISIAQESSSGTYGLPSDEKVYDYVTTGTGPLLREVQTTYEFQANGNYLTADLLNLKASVTTLNGSGTQVAQSSYAYDEPQYSGISSGISTQHTSAPFSVRGELTTKSAWLNGGTNPQSHTSWFDTGEVDQSIDPLGHTTTFGYSSTYVGSLPTQITNAANQNTAYTYDFNTGQKTSVTDPNQQTVAYTYNDPLGRLTDVLYPNLYLGTSLPHGETKYTYNDSASPVNFVVTKVVSPSLSLQEGVYVDGLGREWYTQLSSDPQGTVYSETSYDAIGRVYQEWNSTRCVLPGSTSCSSEPTWGITTHFYDALDRPIKEIPPDGSANANNVSTSYSGNTATVTDQVGVSRTSTADALGRLTQLSENNPGWITAYFYDPLGNLTCVEQHGGVSSTGCSSPPSSDPSSQWRVRRFTYDSLSRLLNSKNPETGTITYGYNADSVLISKTDNRGITVTYSPDVLHRTTSKSFSDSEPTVSYTYDASGTNNYGIGRRTGMTDASGSTTWTYDQVGSASSEIRNIGSVQKQIFTLYNADESKAQVTYPSGAVVSFTPGGAGRVLAVTDTTNNVNYVKSLLYSPPGQINSAVYGYSSGFAGVTETDSFNSRLQPVLLSAAVPSQTVFSLSYGFGLGTNDNGNLYQIQNNKDGTRSQTFTYDGVNRLATAKTASTWGLSFTYDPWGSLYSTSGISGTSVNPQPLSTSSQWNNELLGFGYDGAGDLVSDGTSSACSGSAYTFNAEGQMSCAEGYTYTFDGDGRRVKKSGGMLYFGGEAGAALAESDQSGNVTSEYIFLNGRRIARRDASGTVHYYFSDHLGSSNVVTDANGNIQNESDYYPFGGERIVTQNLTNQRYKFTGKERDSESGNDYFGARYYGSSMGRMLSPDWSEEPDTVPYAEFENPQTLNLYGYARNNPLVYGDPDGHSVQICDDSGRCQTVDDDAYKAAQQASNSSLNGPSLAALQNSSSGAGTLTSTDANGNTTNVGSVQWTPDNPGIQGPSAMAGFNQLANTSRVVKAGTAVYAGVFGGAFACAAGCPAAATAAVGLFHASLYPGMVIGGFIMTTHAVEQAEERGVTPEEIEEAVEGVAKSNPQNAWDSVQRFYTATCEVRVNKITGTIVTVISKISRP